MRVQPRFSILVVDRDPELCGTIALALQSEFGATAFECSDPITAQTFIDDCAELDLCILLDTDQAAELALRTLRMHAGLPIILGAGHLTAGAKLGDSLIGSVARHRATVDIPQIVRAKIFQGEPASPPAGEGDFCQVATRLLLRASPLPVDLYLRISDQKYLKVMKAGDPFEAADHDRFTHQKKVSALFVRHTESHKLVRQLEEGLKKLGKGQPPDVDALRRVTEDLHASVHDIVSHCGVTPEVQDLTRQTVNLVLHTIKGEGDLAGLLEWFTLESDRYIPQHSLLLAEVCCLLAGKLDWVSQLTFQKLILASLYHDLALKNDDLARTPTLAALKLSSANAHLDSIDEINGHPRRAVALVQKLKDVPPDVDQIILHHHEKPDGSGFPTGLNHKSFAPLSALFVLAHDFVDYFLELSAAERVTAFTRFLADAEDRYTQGHFKQIFRELKSRDAKGTKGTGRE